MRSLVLLTGAYGVGKSTLCSEIPLRHLKASSLIFDYLNKQPPKNKVVKDTAHLDENQRVLVEALKNTKISTPTLLEGHTCLLDASNKIQRIPMSVFRAIDLSGIIVVTRNMVSAHKALIVRDGGGYPLSSLIQLQNQELQYTEQISHDLQLPRLHIDLNLISPEVVSKNIQDFITTSCTPV